MPNEKQNIVIDERGRQILFNAQIQIFQKEPVHEKWCNGLEMDVDRYDMKNVPCYSYF